MTADEAIQRWISCPECGSDDARLVHWTGDHEVSLQCPACHTRIEVWDTKASIEYLWGDDGAMKT